MNRDSYIERLLLWKKSNRRKPLILEGARQVGKTRLSLRASPDGSVSFRGFRGTYRVRGIGADGQPCEKTVKVR